MTSKVIEAKDISVSIEGNKILENITFSVDRGAVTAIIGPNGSGKTTLLRTLIGLLPFQPGGRIVVLGKKPRESRPKVGYVPQRFTFDRSFPITVREFLRFSCPGCDELKLKKYLSHFQMDEKENDQLGNLSGGQLQRVLIVRELIRDPLILYLDEPASGIDVSGEMNFYDIIRHISGDHGTTVVMVSHEMDIVYQFATQVLCLNKTLCCAGLPSKVLTSDVLEKLYGKDVALYRHAKK